MKRPEKYFSGMQRIYVPSQTTVLDSYMDQQDRDIKALEDENKDLRKMLTDAHEMWCGGTMQDVRVSMDNIKEWLNAAALDGIGK